MSVREWLRTLLHEHYADLRYCSPEQAEVERIAVATYLRPLAYLSAPCGDAAQQLSYVHIRKTIHVSPETDVLAARAVQRLAARQEYERQARHMGIPCR